MDLDVAYSFATDAWDLVFPIWLDDRTRSVDGPYESEHVRVQEQDVVIDCGGNIGISAANAIARGCKRVYTIEPVQNDSLKKCQELWGDRMSCHNEALSDYEGIATMHICSWLGRNSCLEKNTDTQDMVQSVHVTTLDNFVRENCIEKVDFIKFCIVDQEPKMLIGAKETLRKFSPRIAIFAYSRDDMEECEIRIKNLLRQINPEYKFEHSGSKIFAYTD